MKKTRIFLVALLLALVLVACGGETVEVTRVVTETETVTEEVEVTRVVEGEVVTETVTEEVEVEVTRVIEVEVEADAEPEDTSPIELARFFGLCEGDNAEISDMEDTSNFAGETSIICIMTNAYNAEHPENPIETTDGGWPGVTELNTRLAAGDPPDINVIHGIRIPNYASRGLLTPLSDLLDVYGIDPNEWTDSAREYVTYNDQIYGIPLDLHGHLLFINLDLWEQAGMVDSDGVPMIPTSWADWEAAGEAFFAATGVPLFEMQVGGQYLSREWMAMVYQQGGAIVDADGLPTMNIPEGVAALDVIKETYNGTFSSEDGSSDMWGDFANGLTGSVVGATWGVNFMDAQAADPEIPLTNFYVASNVQFFDQPATWASTHAWIVPLGVNADPARVARIMEWMAWMNENNGVWSYTGHFPVNQSYIGSEEFMGQPHRQEFGEFGDIAIAMPRHNWVTAFEDIMNEEIQAAVLGEKSTEEALADAQSRFDDFVAFGQ